MDLTKIIEALQATLIPDQQPQAEEYLKQVNKIIGFPRQLLQIVMSENLEMNVRQAGAVFLKNSISNHWVEEEKQFSIHEDDKQVIRENIVQAVIAAPNVIRVQLSVCVTIIVKSDYPGRWPGFLEKIMTYISSDQHNTWLGSLICLYKLVKHFEYKKSEERQVLHEAMVHILPVIQNMLVCLLPDQSDASVTIQKQILKIFFSLVQFSLPMELVTKEIFTHWMEMVRQVTDRPVPPECNQVDEDDRPDLVWWKCKKWALHILTRCFERYGSPGNVMKEYTKFAEWYIKTFSAGILEVLLKLLNQYRNKEYITPRILQLTITYLSQAVAHAHSWKILKPHMQLIIQEIVFPLMCHSEEDEELWQNDPIEYIRLKYDVYEEFFNPATAAQTLLHDAVSKRKDVLQKAMAFVMSILLMPNLEARQKSGALQMVGSLSSILMAKKDYKEQIEVMLIHHVIPELANQLGYMRARACWVLHSFSEVKFKNPTNLQMIVEVLANILANDKELPVRIEAAIGLQAMLTDQERAKEIVKPIIQKVIVDLLSLIRETENDDLTGVLQKVVCIYSDDITPLAVEITTHLAQTFAKVIESVDSDSSDDKSITLMGILNTLETICSVLMEEKEVLKNVETVVINVVVYIIQHDVTEFFEEMLTLVYNLTEPQITQNMWGVLPLLYEVFQRDNVEYFVDMMPCLHNYVTVDPGAFLADPKWLEIVFNMCKMVLDSNVGEDNETHAAKLLEVIILQFKGLIDSVMPLIVQLILHRLSREVKTTELRTMCLQVVIAALYYNPEMLLGLVNSGALLPNAQVSIMGHFLKQWLADSDCFLGLHDRKMFVLGFCTLLNLPHDKRPAELGEVVNEILPSMILVFKGLKRAYESRLRDEDTDEENGAEEEDDKEVEDDEDVLDNDEDEYMHQLQKADKSEDGEEDDDYDDEDDEIDETALESYETILDKEDCPVEEYQIFKGVLENLQHSDNNMYQFLTNSLNEEQKKDMEEIFRLAEQRRAAAESKKIEMAGGYNFTNTQIPTSFCFGGTQ